MPYKDPVKRKAANDAWKKRRMEQGYGKALYARRRHRFENERILREGLMDLLETVWSMNPTDDLRLIEQKINEIFDQAPPVTGKPIDYMPEQE